MMKLTLILTNMNNLLPVEDRLTSFCWCVYVLAILRAVFGPFVNSLKYMLHFVNFAKYSSAGEREREQGARNIHQCAGGNLGMLE